MGFLCPSGAFLFMSQQLDGVAGGSSPGAMQRLSLVGEFARLMGNGWSEEYAQHIMA
mgnify:CR=1 FL=1